jgi:hypothetical protein
LNTDVSYWLTVNDFKIFAVTDLGLNVLRLMSSYNISAYLRYSKLTDLEASDTPASISKNLSSYPGRNQAKVLQTVANVLTKLSFITSLVNVVYNQCFFF